VTHGRPDAVSCWEPAVEAAVGVSQLRADQCLVPTKLQAIPPFVGASSSSRPACVSRSTSLAQSTHSPRGQATSISMASLCNPPIADSYPYKPIFRLDFQSPQTPAPSDAIAFGCAARFNLSPADQLTSMDDPRLRGVRAVGQFLSSGCTAGLSGDRDISDSDDDGLPSIRKILAQSKQQEVIDLTHDDDCDSDEDDVIKVSGLRNA
jgi:hypothetical protein